MGKKLLYHCVKQYHEIQTIKSFADADNFYFDIANARNYSNFKDFDRMLKEMVKGDTVVLKSVVRLSSSLDGVYKTLKQLRDKGVELNVTDPVKDEEALLTNEGYRTLGLMLILREKIKKSRGEVEIRVDNQIRRKDSDIGLFPDGFFKVYEEFRGNKIDAKQAAERLGVKLKKFYELQKTFSG